MVPQHASADRMGWRGIVLRAVFGLFAALLLTLSGTPAAYAQTTSAPPTTQSATPAPNASSGPSAPAPTGMPADLGASVIGIVDFKATYYPPQPTSSNKGGPLPGGLSIPDDSYVPQEPFYLEVQLPCSLTTNYRNGSTVILSSANHCVDKEDVGKQALLYDLSTQQRMRDQEKRRLQPQAPPSTQPVPAPGTPQQETKEPELDNITREYYLYQPQCVADRYIKEPALASIITERKLDTGNDSIVVKYQLPDPSVNVPTIPLADSPSPVESPAKAIGYPGTAFQDLDQLIFPAQNPDKKGLLDNIERMTICPQVTTGTVSGRQDAGAPVTGFDLALYGGMSGGTLANAQNQQLAVITGGNVDIGSSNNFGSSDIDLLRQDERAAGAIIPLTAAEQANLRTPVVEIQKAAQQDPTGNDAQSSVVWWTLGVAIAALALSAITLGLWLYRNYRNRHPRPAATEQRDEAQQERIH